jgi:hypothetical protein
VIDNVKNDNTKNDGIEIKRIPTTEVLTQLINSDSFEAFYAENVDKLHISKPHEYLNDLCEIKGILAHRLFREVDVDKSCGYKIIHGKRRLSRDNAIKFAFGLELSI